MIAKEIITLTIQDFHNGGGNLTVEVGASSIGAADFNVVREPDQYSSRLLMFAYLHDKNGYQNLGFPEVTLTTDTYSTAACAPASPYDKYQKYDKSSAKCRLTSRSTHDFFEVRVIDYKRLGKLEIINFDFKKHSQFAIANVKVLP